MAQTITVSSLPDTITLLDTTTHTINLEAGFDIGGISVINYQTIFVVVKLAATTVKFNNSGDPSLSNKTFVTGDEFFMTVNAKHPIRILGSLNDVIDIYS